MPESLSWEEKKQQRWRERWQQRQLWFYLVLLGVLLDFVTKQVAATLLTYGETISIFSFLHWTLLYNEGAAFSFLSDQSGWQRWFFTLVSFLASLLISVWLLRTKLQDKLTLWGLTLLLSGAIGNLIDRLFFGKVIDFIHVAYGWFNWPVFNLADIFITCGVGLVLLASFMEKRAINSS